MKDVQNVFLIMKLIIVFVLDVMEKKIIMNIMRNMMMIIIGEVNIFYIMENALKIVLLVMIIMMIMIIMIIMIIILEKDAKLVMKKMENMINA